MNPTSSSLDHKGFCRSFVSQPRCYECFWNLIIRVTHFVMFAKKANIKDNFSHLCSLSYQALVNTGLLLFCQMHHGRCIGLVSCIFLTQVLIMKLALLAALMAGLVNFINGKMTKNQCILPLKFVKIQGVCVHIFDLVSITTRYRRQTLCISFG